MDKKIISYFLIAIIIIILGYFFYKDFTKKTKTKLAERYNLAVIKYNNDNKSLVTQELKEIVLKKDNTYSPLALYFLIDNQLINSKEEINTYFDFIIENTRLEKEIKNLIVLKKSMFNSDHVSENDLLQILNPIINS